jgi:DNA polymerase-4
MDEIRRILHLDLDAFFCAVEEKFKPDLKGKAFAVGGRPDKRGVVASCSYPARKYGVHSAMPMAQAVRICPELIVVSSSYHSYSAESRVVMDYLRTISPLLEQISIDEAFLDITALDGATQDVASRIQDKIRHEFGLPNSIGAARNKLVAKIANDYGKKNAGHSGPPNAITIVPPGEEAGFLAPLPVKMLWGVGPKTAEKLAALGIHRIGDIAALPERELGEKFGKHGWDLARRARGIDERPIETEHDVKSISQETTFPEDIADPKKLHEVLTRLATKVAGRLEKNDLCGRTIKIKLRYEDFTTLTRQTSLSKPTNDAELIAARAIGLFDQTWEKRRRVRLLGVGVSGLDDGQKQLGLWDRDWQHETAVHDTLNQIRKRFGSAAIHKGLPVDDPTERPDG